MCVTYPWTSDSSAWCLLRGGGGGCALGIRSIVVTPKDQVVFKNAITKKTYNTCVYLGANLGQRKKSSNAQNAFFLVSYLIANSQKCAFDSRCLSPLSVFWGFRVRGLDKKSPRALSTRRKKRRQTPSVARRESGGGRGDELNKPSDSPLGSTARLGADLPPSHEAHVSNGAASLAEETAHSAPNSGVCWAEGDPTSLHGRGEAIPCTTTLEVVWKHRENELAELTCCARERHAGTTPRRASISIKTYLL